MVRTIYAVRLAFADRFLENSRRRFGDLADTFLKLYPAGSDDEAFASQLAPFRDELAWVMRQWAALQSRTGKSKAYLYYFTHQPPAQARHVEGGAREQRMERKRRTPSTIWRRRAPGRIWTASSRTPSLHTL